MKLKISRDVSAPADKVFEAMSDFPRFEAEIAGRRAQLARVGRWKAPEESRHWHGVAKFRGRTRNVEAKLSRWRPGEALTISAQVGGMRVTYDMGLVALGRDITRITIVLELHADTLSARLYLQSLKLSRQAVLGRMRQRLDIEARRLERRAA